MKNTIAKLLLFVSIICCIFTLSACKKEEKIIENDEQTQNYIKQEYLSFYLSDEPEATIDDINIWLFLGIYDNAYVAVFIDHYYRSIFMAASWKENIGGINIVYPDSNVILVYKNHRFYTLMYAYDSNILTIEHIKEIKQRFNGR